MKRHELEHVIRAAASIAGDSEIVVIGSQAILGQFPDAPQEMCTSNEADVYPLNQPHRWELIDGSIGELSPFHETFGYYAQGVQEGTATLPEGWKTRLVPVSTADTCGATGLCLEVHDLVISKYVAGREKDRRFVQFAVRHGLVSQATLLERLAFTPVSDSDSVRIRDLVRYDCAGQAQVGL
jgi:hypothetical protein